MLNRAQDEDSPCLQPVTPAVFWAPLILEIKQRYVTATIGLEFVQRAQP